MKIHSLPRPDGDAVEAILARARRERSAYLARHVRSLFGLGPRSDATRPEPARAKGQPQTA